MHVIALVGNKGGAGKTTLCVNLAAAMASMQPSLILDADPQQSSLQWRDIAEGSESVEVVRATGGLERVVEQIDDDWSHCLVDCPPSVHSRQMQEALRVADLAVIPIQPSPLDIWATVHIENEIVSARKENPRLNALMVINQLEPRTRLSQIMHRALAELSLPSAETPIRRRAVYRNSFLEGRTVHDMGSRGRAASEEIHQLLREIRQQL
jgi:chromosome partitioning protein